MFLACMPSNYGEVTAYIRTILCFIVYIAIGFALFLQFYFDDLLPFVCLSTLFLLFRLLVLTIRVHFY